MGIVNRYKAMSYPALAKILKTANKKAGYASSPQAQ